jgi:hypothetical protein
MADTQRKISTVDTAVHEYIQGPAYHPHQLSVVSPENWAEIFEGTDVVRCEELSSTGTEILNFVLFILLSEMGVLRGKPSGFVQVQATRYSDAGPWSDETSRL